MTAKIWAYTRSHIYSIHQVISLNTEGDLSSWQHGALEDLKPFFFISCFAAPPLLSAPSLAVCLPLSLLWPNRPEGAESFLCHRRCVSQSGGLAFSCRLAGWSEEHNRTELQERRGHVCSQLFLSPPVAMNKSWKWDCDEIKASRVLPSHICHLYQRPAPRQEKEEVCCRTDCYRC